MAVELFAPNYFSNTGLVFYDMVVSVASRLGSCSFMEEFLGSIYTYPRRDTPNRALPAVHVYSDTIQTSSSGFFWYSTVTIEIYRNASTSNRGAIYNFHQSYSERIIQAICMDNEFYARSLTRDRDYIVLWGDSFRSYYDEERKCSVIDIVAKIYYPAYLRWCSRNAFNFNNKDFPIVQVDGFGVEAIMYPPPTEPNNIDDLNIFLFDAGSGTTPVEYLLSSGYMHVISLADSEVPTEAPVTETITVTGNRYEDVINEATIKIGNYISGEDALSFEDTDLITGSWNATTGVMTLTGLASFENYQAAFRSVTYVNSANPPTFGVRTFIFEASGEYGSVSNKVYRSINLVN